MIDRSSELVQVTLADYIYPAIQKQYIAILTHEADVSADGDVEAIHEMRVSLRRLRSLIQGFRSIVDVPKVMSENQIAQIAKILGKVRDLDVLEDICKTYQIDLPAGEQLYLAEVVSKLGKRRRKALAKVHAMLEEKEYQYFKLAINNWLNNPQYTSTVGVPTAEILPNLILPVVGQLFLNSGWWIDNQIDGTTEPESAVAQLLILHGTALHSLRKQVKATRYLLELFPDLYPSQYENYLKDFHQIHKILGNIQDGVVLDSSIQGIVGKRAVSKLPTLYERLDRDRYLNWQNWLPLQAKYQQSSVRQELQLLLIQGIISVDSLH
jgi:CHAD domain-containing protein